MTYYWIAAGLTILLTATAFIIWLTMRRKKQWSSNILAHCAFIASLYGLIITLAHTAYTLLDQHKITSISSNMIKTTTMIAMALIALQQIFQLINRLTKSQISKGSDPTSAHIVARILKMILFVILVLIFGEHLGISLTGLMAFGGVGGIAIGLAAKDMLSNVFSGIMLYFDRPFNIGDWISSPDRTIEGTVVEIGWRLTKIITFDHRPLYVPNAVFSSISVENPGRMTNRRIKTTIGMRYEDASRMAAIITDIKAMLRANEKIDQKQTMLVNFTEFADSSLNIMIYCFTKTTVWSEWLDAQQEVYLKIVDIVHSNGADFAFDSQTIYLEKS